MQKPYIKGILISFYSQELDGWKMPDCWEKIKKKKIPRLESAPSCACLVVQLHNYLIILFSPWVSASLDHTDRMAHWGRVKSGLGSSQHPQLEC